MGETVRLGLPLVAGGQAQKHVTVNTAFERLDALTQLVIASRGVSVPPLAPDEGEVYAVPAGAVNAWSGEDGRLAMYLGGGWVFVGPVQGWRAWVSDEATLAVFDGTDWVEGAQSVSPSGAAFLHRVIEIDHAVAAGPVSTTSAVIPSGAIVFGVTGRVLSSITGTAASFQLGIDGVSSDRYGSGIGLAAGAWLRGVTSAPVAYYADTALTLTGEGGDFSGGTVRLAVHVAELTLPSA